MSHTIIDLPERSASKPGAVRRWSALLLKSTKRRIAQFRENRRIRRDLPILLALDDRTLADIGLRRGDLPYVARYGRAASDTSAGDRH
jgi:uncharacterized protein YjiS (DUF1127 family)